MHKIKVMRNALSRITIFGLLEVFVLLIRLIVQTIPMISITRVPEHPAMGAKIFCRSDLPPNFCAIEGSLVKGIISECLEPWPESNG
jgi:hypothetical protein